MAKTSVAASWYWTNRLGLCAS